MDSSSSAEDRFQRMYRANVQPVYEYFLRRVDPDAAPDLTAETLAVAWRRPLAAAVVMAV